MSQKVGSGTKAWGDGKRGSTRGIHAVGGKVFCGHSSDGPTLGSACREEAVGSCGFQRSVARQKEGGQPDPAHDRGSGVGDSP